MNTIHEPARDVPVAADCDLCVLGGSCTGVFAAVAAARLGLRVALVEAQGFFGGVATAARVNVWHSLFDEKAQRQIIAGMSVEVVERLKRRGAVDDRGPGPNYHFAFNPAELAIELDEVLVEAKVRPFLHARFVAPVSDAPGHLTAAIIEDKTGRRAIRAKIFIDATGDADVVQRLGLPTHTNEQLQPPTMAALIAGLDEVWRHHPGLNLGEVVFDPKYREALRPGFLWWANVPGLKDLRMLFGTRVHGANCADADQLTAAEIEGRRQVRRMVDLFRNNFSGGNGVALAALPATLGLRETRRAVCQYTLSEPDVLNGVRFADAIANGSYRVDIHSAHGAGLIFRYLDGREDEIAPGQPRRSGRWRPPQPVDPTFYQIPFRSLLPQGTQNLLVAGRGVGADKGAVGAIRVMINCNQTGEAAGVAAWLAVSQGLPVAAVAPAALRAQLAKQGAIVI